MVTIHLKPSTHQSLQNLKLVPREPYNDVIERLIQSIDLKEFTFPGGKDVQEKEQT